MTPLVADTALLGGLAGLGAALSWAFASIFFTEASRRLGSALLNRTRLLLAAVLLAGAHYLLYGSLWPSNLTPDGLFWLAISGLAAHVFGDGALYMAYVRVGPRLSMLVGTVTPVLSALLAWAFLGEILAPADAVAVALTLSGVAWVVGEGRGAAGASGGGERRLGLLLALGSTAVQAVGIITARHVLAGGLAPVAAVLVRVTVSAAVMWAWTGLRGQVGSSLRSLYLNRQALASLAAGTITGPLVGASLSLAAVQAVQVGIASTLMAMPPVFLLPLSALVYKEKITVGAVLGTVVAIAGVGLLVMA